MTRVFMSYAREDTDKARKLCADLRDAGMAPWLDQAATMMDDLVI